MNGEWWDFPFKLSVMDDTYSKKWHTQCEAVRSLGKINLQNMVCIEILTNTF